MWRCIGHVYMICVVRRAGLRSRRIPHFGQSPGCSLSTPSHMGQKYSGATLRLGTELLLNFGESPSSPQQWAVEVGSDTTPEGFIDVIIVLKNRSKRESEPFCNIP